MRLWRSPWKLKGRSVSASFYIIHEWGVRKGLIQRFKHLFMFELNSLLLTNGQFLKISRFSKVSCFGKKMAFFRVMDYFRKIAHLQKYAVLKLASQSNRNQCKFSTLITNLAVLWNASYFPQSNSFQWKVPYYPKLD